MAWRGGKRKGPKSRKECRKEARRAKHEQRQRSWMLHQARSRKGSQKLAPALQQESNSSPPLIQKEKGAPKDGGTPERKVKRARQKQQKPRPAKFEEYPEMGRQNRLAGFEDDLALERRLAKKLKLNRGLLRGCVDGMAELLEGTAPFLSDAGLEVADYEAPQRRRINNLQEDRAGPLLDSSSDGSEDENGIGSSESGAGELEDDGTTEEPDQDFDESTEIIEDGKANFRSNYKKPSTKYVAPHLRDSIQSDSNDTRVKRHIRGLLNRLSEENVESIASEISSFFQIHGRRILTSILTEEILGALCDGPRGNDQYAAVFAAFIAGVASLNGMDFGAKFVASFAERFEDCYNCDNGLATSNLALLYSNLYNFNLLESDMVYHFLHLLCKRFKELDVSTILRILQTCGMSLRSEDPVAMKDFVLAVQQRTEELKAIALHDNTGSMTGKRMQYMLEIILDIKNNKRRLKEESVPHARLKKWLQKLRIDDVQLRAITWEKLLDHDKKGQWWLSGDIMGSVEDECLEISSLMDREAAEAEKVLQLAVSQRMNTEIRRAVFCIIMSAEDYLDAFEKILRLDLHGKKDRDVIRVIVECCLQEKTFNKYYSLLCAKMCQHNKNHKFTLQYCIWDHFKQLDSMENRRIVNLAHLLANLVGTRALSLSALKAVDFGDSSFMTPKVVLHFKNFLETLLLNFSDETISIIFSCVASSPELQNLRDGLSLFLHLHFKKATCTEPNELDVKSILRSRYKLAKMALKNVATVF